MNNTFSNVVAAKTFNLLNERKALIYGDGTAFYLWPLADRLVIVFDADEIHLPKVDDEFAHVLSSRLQGRRVKRTNSRGVFLQIGLDISPAPLDLVEIPLDMSKQPTPTSLPIGMTGRGPLWIDLLDADSILLTGSRGMGKTGMMHGWAQCLLNGDQVEVRAWDGKDGSEFGRYADRSKFRLLVNLEQSLRDLLLEAKRRRETLTRSGHPNAKVYSQYVEPMTPVVLMIDEAALVPERSRSLLVELVERCRDTGVYPIFGTNNPQQSSLIVKSNLVTRISLAVPSLAASVMSIGMSGAEKLPKVQGRGLMEWGARMVEFQSFHVTYPVPTAEAVTKLMMVQEEAEAPAIEEQARILELHGQGKSAHAIAGELFGLTSGRPYLRKLDEIKAITSTSATSAPAFVPEIAL